MSWGISLSMPLSLSPNRQTASHRSNASKTQPQSSLSTEIIHNGVCFGALCASLRWVNDVGFAVIELCGRDEIDLLTCYFVTGDIQVYGNVWLGSILHVTILHGGSFLMQCFVVVFGFKLFWSSHSEDYSLLNTLNQFRILGKFTESSKDIQYLLWHSNISTDARGSEIWIRFRRCERFHCCHPDSRLRSGK